MEIATLPLVALNDRVGIRTQPYPLITLMNPKKDTGVSQKRPAPTKNIIDKTVPWCYSDFRENSMGRKKKR